MTSHTTAFGRQDDNFKPTVKYQSIKISLPSAHGASSPAKTNHLASTGAVNMLPHSIYISSRILDFLQRYPHEKMWKSMLVSVQKYVYCPFKPLSQLAKAAHDRMVNCSTGELNCSINGGR